MAKRPCPAEYVVESILDDKLRHGKQIYLVKWQDDDTPTWQPSDDLVNCDEVLHLYRSVSTFILFLVK